MISNIKISAHGLIVIGLAFLNSFAYGENANSVDVDAELAKTLQKLEPPCIPNLIAALSKHPFSASEGVERVQPAAKTLNKRSLPCSSIQNIPGKTEVCLSNELKIESQKAGTSGTSLGVFGKYGDCPFKIGIVSIPDIHQFEDAISANAKCKSELTKEFSDYLKHPYILRNSPQVEFTHHFITNSKEFSPVFDFELKSARTATGRTYKERRPNGIFVRADQKYATKMIESPDKVVFMTSRLDGSDFSMIASFSCKIDANKTENLATILLSAPN